MEKIRLENALNNGIKLNRNFPLVVFSIKALLSLKLYERWVWHQMQILPFQVINLQKFYNDLNEKSVMTNNPLADYALEINPK